MFFFSTVLLCHQCGQLWWKYLDEKEDEGHDGDFDHGDHGDLGDHVGDDDDGNHECRWDPNRSLLDWQITPDARYTELCTVVLIRWVPIHWIPCTVFHHVHWFSALSSCAVSFLHCSVSSHWAKQCSIVFLDAIAFPSTYPCGSLSDSYRHIAYTELVLMNLSNASLCGSYGQLIFSIFFFNFFIFLYCFLN